ncbi:MAG: hypothetical protein C7B44_00030 [Sulfobacillus thermosulfidooxidans]|uniref:GDT1 family protein n=1 Tax=Sulfobacillus thermotolerans TaxID=338644 RepID=A0ABM6RNV2_9FIRM|nr:hypothetical protein BXT84_02990 [Sulfobacillus thermotolerans]PSR38121.1 MAG: hypothetical protein C7B44_00030 [Sulfobacillus thermosulfidooxidans]
MNLYVLLAAFLASSVEFVEALSIVLAAAVFGVRPAMRGVFYAVLTLAALVLILGEGILRVVPLHVLQGVVGILLLLFGLKWIRKAILRYAGLKALHNEAEAYARQVKKLEASSNAAFEAQATAFNGVLLEGLEVVVIILTMGSGAHAFGSAILGSAIGLVAVLALGLALRAPLSRVPENTLKFVVGVMLTSFGTFWAGAALGVHWPLSEATLLVLIAGYLAMSGWYVKMLKARGQASA